MLNSVELHQLCDVGSL